MVIGEKEAIGAGAVAFGWLAAIFTQGRRVGRVEEQFKALVGKVAGHDQELGKLRKAVENLTAAMIENTKVVAKMGDQIHTLRVDVAVLKDRRNTGRRNDEGKEENDINN